MGVVAALFTHIHCHSSLLCLQILWNHNYYVELYTKGKGKGLYAVTHHFIACKSMEPQLLYCYSLTNPNLIFCHKPKWKTTKMEDDQNGRRPKWKTIKMEDDQNGRRPKWKMSQMEDDQN